MVTQLTQFRLRPAAVALGIAAFVMLLPAAAAATPSTITSVKVEEGAPVVEWNLPPEHVNGIIEVATSPATTSEGEFFFPNVWASDFPAELQTSWTGNVFFAPGTYYVHVSNCDETEFLFCVPGEEWSNIKSFVIPQPPGPGVPGPAPGLQGVVPPPSQPPPPNLPKLPDPECKNKPNSIRYVGRTRLGGKLCLTLSRNRKRVTTFKFRGKADCTHGTLEGLYIFPPEKVGKKGNFSAYETSEGSIIDSEFYVQGKVNGRQARGVVNVEGSTPAGKCDSGFVRWTAHRG